jgi:hypothetical protein
LDIVRHFKLRLETMKYDLYIEDSSIGKAGVHHEKNNSCC